MQKPPGVGNPPAASLARFAAFGPTRSGSVAAGSARGTIKVKASIAEIRRLLSSPRLRGRDRPKRAERARDGGRGHVTRSRRSYAPPARYARHLPRKRGRKALAHVIAVARQRIDNRYLLHRKIGNDLDAVFLDNEHFLDAHAIAEF